MSSLIYKRHRETPKRLWKIWCVASVLFETIQVLILSLWLQRLFDVSKQVVGQMFVHGVNVFVSHLGSSTTESNACVFYFLNILIDTTLGKFLLSISD